MPRISYGPQTKKRTKQLLTVLLDYANDELNCDEFALEGLRREIKTDWKDERQLIVQTKLRFLEGLLDLTGNRLTIPQIKEALNRLTDFLEILEDHRPVKRGSETWHFTLTFWYKRRDRTAILQQFDREWEQRRPQKSKQASPTPDLSDALPSEPVNNKNEENPWWKCCQESLQTQQIERLTTNALMVSDGVKFEVQEVYVPLGLMQWQSQPEPSEDAEDTETENIINPELFLQQLIASQEPQRLAIIGEPGSGKTTVLQRIANELLAQQFLPIWISLADLQGKTLEQYLLNDWLKIATRKIILPPELQEEFAGLFQQGRVWLLLDAIDEMAIESSVALSSIARQLRGWIADAHILITCRINVWEIGKNPLADFKTYRNLSFLDQPSQSNPSQPINLIEQFIQKWFQHQLELGNHLCKELNQNRHQKIRETVRNPLCLALLCRIWTVMQGNFPNTKAALYNQFVQTLYEWKQDRFPTTLAQRQRLNQVLGKIALQAFLQVEKKFRFSQSFVETILDTEEIDLFSFALQLGWLHPVGVSSITGDRIYAFYHSTFQEYFAAQAVENWQFFMDTSFPQPPIFSSQWREIILLWLGRLDVENSEKEAFLQALIDFEDNCGQFYQYQAYFLAGSGLAEFPEFSQADDIIAQLIRWCYGEYDENLGKRVMQPAPIIEKARSTLFSTDRQQAIQKMENFVQSVDFFPLCCLGAYSLGKNFDLGNKVAETKLLYFLETAPDHLTRMEIAHRLGQVSIGHPLAINTLAEILNSASEDSLRRKAAYRLGKIDPGNQAAINTLVNLIESPTTSQKIKSRVIKDLRQISPEHPLLMSKFPINKLAEKPSLTRSKQKLNDLHKKRTALEHKLTATQEIKFKRKIAISLLKIQPGHPEAVSVFLESLKMPKQTTGVCKRTVELLKNGLQEEQFPQIVTALKDYAIALNQGERSPQTLEIYKLLWYIAQQMNYADYYAAWHQVEN